MRLSVPFALLALLSLGCGKEKLVPVLCEFDSECSAGLLCDNGACIPSRTKSCDVVTDGKPLLQPSPHAVSLGAIDVSTGKQAVVLSNIGNCTLTLFEASLEKGTDSVFTCAACGQGFPREIFPGRSIELELEMNATQVGEIADALVLLSDDVEYPTLKVPLRADFIGKPKLQATPSPVDFGYLAQGLALKKRVQLTNQGTGIAPITITKVSVAPDTTNFELIPEFTEAVTLKPISTDKTALTTLEVQYHPRSSEQHTGELVIETSKGEYRVKLEGNALSPPKMSITPDAIRLGDVPLGKTNVLPLTILNEGAAPLQVSYKWASAMPPPDLFVAPAAIPPIAPGAFVEVQVGMTATALGDVTGLLVVTSNDPMKASVTIPVTAKGIPGAGPAVVKVELVYENGSDSAFDADLRNVDLTLEHPFGFVCNKQYPKPMGWGAYGDPTWLGLGVKEEPERIVLANATADGTYRVQLSYVEDCASLPTELTAGLLGISVDALIAYLTGGVGNIGIDGSDIGKIISNVCLSRKNSPATVKVWSNGTLLAEKTVSLSKKGDTPYVMDLVRSGGSFTVP